MDLEKKEQEILEKNIEELQKLSKEDLEKILEAKISLDNPLKEHELNKVLDCAHEIIFTINAHVLTQNEKGELTGTKEICVKNYHIPVPIDKDYVIYMKAFFDYLEQKILESIQDTNRTAKDKEETE